MMKTRIGDYFGINGVGSVTVCGVGPDCATRAANRLVRRGASALLGWGIAGGVNPALQPGDLVVPDQIYMHSGAQVACLDTEWHRQVCDTLLSARVPVTSGHLWSSDQPVATAVEKQRLAQRDIAIVDMESAAVAVVAAKVGLPFMTIKAVCDPATRDIPVRLLEALGPHGRVNGLGALKVACGGLATWRAAGSLQKDLTAAVDTLTHAAGILPAIAGYTCAHE